MSGFRIELIYGLAVLAAVWAVVYGIAAVVVKGAPPGADVERVRRRKGLLHRIMISAGVIVFLLWALAAALTGWRAGDIEEPTGELVETPELRQEAAVKPPTLEDKREEVREKGEDLQEEGKQKLDDFRRDFYEKRKADKQSE